jgi:nucleotide-binding universal stress UspA family protein
MTVKSKKVLMAHDLSTRSERALERAVQLATQLDAVLDVVHVVEDDLPAAIVQRRKAEAEKAISDQLSAMPGLGERKIVVTVLAGKDYTDILAQADRLSADLIVLATHRADALRHVAVGSTAERVIGFGHYPVLVVRDKPQGRYRRVLMLADVSAASRSAAHAAFALFPDAEFRLVHVLRTPLSGAPHSELAILHTFGAAGPRKEDLLAFLCPASLRPEKLELTIHRGATLGVLRQEIDHFHPDVLVAGVQRDTGLTRALIGEVAEELLSQPPCDLLAVHE